MGIMKHLLHQVVARIHVITNNALGTYLMQGKSSVNVSFYWHHSRLHIVNISALVPSFFLGRDQFPLGKHLGRPVGGVGRDETPKL